MSGPSTPTLEDLRDVPEAAWLWDGARARIVWANLAGIAWFGGATLFDVIDRVFDFSEPGVEQISRLSRGLKRGQVETLLLHFPSSGHTAPLPCRCMVHALADGRPGILVVARQSAAEQAQLARDDVFAAFDMLPSAALLVGKDGGVRHLNAAALLLLGAGQRATLAGVMGSQAAADDLMDRVAAAGTMVTTKAMPVRIGSRDIKITGRVLNRGDESAHALILLDDVTERRALEIRLSGAGEAKPSAAGDEMPKLSASDAEAFEKLGKTLEEGIRHVPRREAKAEGEPAPAVPKAAAAPAETKPAGKAEEKAPEPAVPVLVAEPVPPAPPPPERRKLQRLPDQLRLPLENWAEAVLVAKDGMLLFANPAAARLFGYETGEDVINDGSLSSRFAQLGQSLPSADFTTAAGMTVTATVSMAVIPWLGGPARKFVLRQSEPRKIEPLPDPRPSALAITPTPRRREDPPQPVKAETPAVSREAPAPVSPPPPAPPLKPSAEVIQLPVRNGPPEADQELRAILDTAADGIITLDPDAKIHTFSAGAEAIFGYRIAEVAGKPFLDLLAPESRKLVRDYLAALQGPGLASVFNDGREVTAIVRQGGTVPLFLTIGRLQAPKSQAAFCAVVRDITQWKKTEAELREAKEKAEATSRQKSEFLASVSHELRTPLNAIMGFSEVMRLGRFGEIDNEKYRGYVQDIHSSGSHLLSLINDLLDLSKVEAGKLELNFTAVNLADVADHAMKLLQEQATAARVVLRKSFPADLPNVVADLRSMRQIMLNLVSNAIKFTDPGGQVLISAQVTAEGELKLRVKDTGIGMDEEQLRGALEPFGRVATEGREVQGTGLGLPLTKALTEANRAQFALTSEPRRGTLAEITFPTTRVLAA